MNKRFATLVFALFSFITFSLASIGGLLYALMGHKVLEQMYLGEASGALAGLRLSGAVPLNAHLERADWFTVGAVFLLFTAWLLFAITLFPKRFAHLGSWLKAYSAYAFAAGLIVLVLALFLPVALPAFLLVRLFLSWLGLVLMMMSVPAVRSSRAAGEGTAAALLFMLATYVLYLVTGNDSSLALVFAEDTFFENLQVLLLLVASLLSLVVFLRPKTRERNSFYLLFFIAFLFFALEELSWGQRIFGFETPFFMNNADNEAVFYKALGLGADILLSSGMLVWGIILPFLNAFVPNLRKLLARLDFPILPWPAVAAVALGLGIYLVVPSYPYAGNIRETFFAFGFIFFALETLLHSRHLTADSSAYPRMATRRHS